MRIWWSSRDRLFKPNRGRPDAAHALGLGDAVAYLPPISRPVGRERQIYSVNSNENTYTNDWTGPFNGQSMLVNTLRNTDQPRRLKGFNLYYHMYSGEKQAALKSVH